ncbi:aromatic compound dioxygenase [Epithele typhae]|uniref:aromatic compound dioxygenase n=1 Tax=Epithele typhae TaxID=378194 RepID=UPI002007DFC0|nr:aromatic compound dioxygenase [Epithele typhae]KAH9942311.1 aromatic compound dioxygenase [Epithele typhae]
MASEQQMKNPLLVGRAIRAQLEKEIPTDLPLERDFREETDYTITDHVQGLHQSLCKDPRSLELITSLVSHLHAFARETQLTHDEWLRAVTFLTRAGKESTEYKNEFVLLSDCLGFSALVDEVNHPKPPGCTDGCEEGPFWTKDAPTVPSGSSLAKKGTTGESMYFAGTIKNLQGEVVKGATATSQWQADGDGLYDVQYPNREEANDRGTIVANPDGTFNYRGILPTAYPIPGDGPIGDLLHALGRHPHRASHIHFNVKAPGYDELTSALYPSHSPFLGTDPVFATKKSLICQLVEEQDPRRWAAMGFADGEVQSGRVWVWKYDFVLPTLGQVEELKKTRAQKYRAAAKN